MTCGVYGDPGSIYSLVYYGGVCFPEEPEEGILIWHFEVDWDGDTVFTEEGVRLQGFTLKRGRNHLTASDGSGYTHYSPGEATAVLDNSDGRYDFFNTSSPIYPDVTPGKFVRISVEGGVNTYPVMRGVISGVQPFLKDGVRKVSITVVDGLQYLRDVEVRTDVFEAEQIDDLAILAVLDGAGWNLAEWPAGDTTPTSKQVPIFYTWNKRALEVLNDLADASAGVFFHARDGTAYFADGSNLNIDINVVIEADKVLRDITIRQPWDNIFNDVKVGSTPLIGVTPTEPIWELADQVVVPAGGSVDIEAEFSYQSYPCALQAALVAGNVNYTVGSGSLTPSIIGGSSGGAVVRFSNAGGSPVTITSADIQEDVYYAPYTNRQSAVDSASQTAYGIRSFVLVLTNCQQTLYANEMAQYLLDRWKDPTIYPTVKVEARPWIQFSAEIYLTRFLLSIPLMNIFNLYRVGQIQHEWRNENGQSVLTTFALEPWVAEITFTGS